jgi:hypothetical protein
MHTQEAASLKSAVKQLQLHREIATENENIDVYDDSDWLHRNDAYHMQVSHHTQTYSSIFPTMTPGIIFIVHYALFNNITMLTLDVNI